MLAAIFRRPLLPAIFTVARNSGQAQHTADALQALGAAFRRRWGPAVWGLIADLACRPAKLLQLQIAGFPNQVAQGSYPPLKP